jgi:hypothetical protein
MRTMSRARALAFTLVATLVLGACSSDGGTGPDGSNGDGGGDGGSNGGGSLPAELVGSWHTGSVSMIDYYDPYTGSWSPPSGDGYSYTFTSDGKFTYAGILQISVYSCTTTLFEYLEGTAEVQGTRLVIKPKKGKFKSKDTCNERYNYEKDADLDRDEYGWEIGINEYDQEVLRMTWPSGEVSEYRRQE